MPEVHDEPETPGPDDLEELRGLAGRLRVEPVGWEQPPATLWDRIAENAGVSPAGESMRPSVATDDDREPVPIVRAPRPLARRSRVAWVLAAAAVIVVAVGFVLVNNRSADPAVVASAPLERLGRSGRGDAELVNDDGNLRLRVQTAGLNARGGFHELWVIDPQVRRLVSLGPLRSDGVYDLPSNLDPEKFPIVDVSVEPLDGNPAHSSDSVLRGRLKF